MQNKLIIISQRRENVILTTASIQIDQNVLRVSIVRLQFFRAREANIIRKFSFACTWEYISCRCTGINVPSMNHIDGEGGRAHGKCVQPTIHRSIAFTHVSIYTKRIALTFDDTSVSRRASRILENNVKRIKGSTPRVVFRSRNTSALAFVRERDAAFP